MMTPLACAVVNGHVEAVKCLLEQHQSVIDETALEDDTNMCKEKQEERNDCHEAALLTALLREHVKISELIIDNSDMGVFKSVNTLCAHYPQKSQQLLKHYSAAISGQGAFRTTAGSGNARHERNSTDIVTTVEWCTIPLKQAGARIFGGAHSFLIFTLTPQGPDSPSRKVMIEKARTRDCTCGANILPDELVPFPVCTCKGFKNGIMLSSVLFSGRFDKRPWRTKDTGVLKQNITLRMVYAEAVGSDLDTYDVTDRNCHHMALHVVNFCCISEAQETKMPNALLCSVGSRLSSTLGIKFEQSASLGSLGSDSFDEESNAQDQPEMCIPDENVDGSSLSENALLCAQFSQWIYNEEFPSVDTLPLSLDRSTLHCHKECVDEPVRWAAAGTQQHCSFPLYTSTPYVFS
jgi:hypothetical protein